MSMYGVAFLPSAARELSKLEPDVRRRIARRIDRLARDPRGDAHKLRNSEDVWRVRAGDYRILYEVRDDRLLILVIRIGHRRDVYG